jgi:hypothetical protein
MKKLLIKLALPACSFIFIFIMKSVSAQNMGGHVPIGITNCHASPPGFSTVNGIDKTTGDGLSPAYTDNTKTKILCYSKEQ